MRFNESFNLSLSSAEGKSSGRVEGADDRLSDTLRDLAVADANKEIIRARNYYATSRVAVTREIPKYAL